MVSIPVCHGDDLGLIPSDGVKFLLHEKIATEPRSNSFIIICVFQSGKLNREEQTGEEGIWMNLCSYS